MIPARILVPPTSTPMTRFALTGGGYHTPPDGGRREAVPALSRRPRQGEGPDPHQARAEAAPRRGAGRCELSRPGPEEGAEAPPTHTRSRRPADPRRAPRARGGLDGGGIPGLCERGVGGEQAARRGRTGCPEPPGRRPDLDADGHPPAGQR